jgi:hypothetical protein
MRKCRQATTRRRSDRRLCVPARHLREAANSLFGESRGRENALNDYRGNTQQRRPRVPQISNKRMQAISANIASRLGHR